MGPRAFTTPTRCETRPTVPGSLPRRLRPLRWRLPRALTRNSTVKTRESDIESDGSSATEEVEEEEEDTRRTNTVLFDTLKQENKHSEST